MALSFPINDGGQDDGGRDDGGQDVANDWESRQFVFICSNSLLSSGAVLYFHVKSSDYFVWLPIQAYH